MNRASIISQMCIQNAREMPGYGYASHLNAFLIIVLQSALSPKIRARRKTTRLM
jgi:hypothetical protein